MGPAPSLAAGRAGHRPGEPGGPRRREPWDDHPVERSSSGHLRGSAPLSLHRDHKAGRGERQHEGRVGPMVGRESFPPRPFRAASDQSGRELGPVFDGSRFGRCVLSQGQFAAPPSRPTAAAGRGGAWHRRAGGELAHGLARGAHRRAVAGWLGSCRAPGAARCRRSRRGARSGAGRMIGPALVALVLVHHRVPSVGGRRSSGRRWPVPIVVDAGYLVALRARRRTVADARPDRFAIEVAAARQFLLVGRLALGAQAAVVVCMLRRESDDELVGPRGQPPVDCLANCARCHHSQEDLSVPHDLPDPSPRARPPTCQPCCRRFVLGGGAAQCPVAALITYGCLVTLPMPTVRWVDFGPLGDVVRQPGTTSRLHHARVPIGPRRTVNLGFVARAGISSHAVRGTRTGGSPDRPRHRRPPGARRAVGGPFGHIPVVLAPTPGGPIHGARRD